MAQLGPFFVPGGPRPDPAAPGRMTTTTTMTMMAVAVVVAPGSPEWPFLIAGGSVWGPFSVWDGPRRDLAGSGPVRARSGTGRGRDGTGQAFASFFWFFHFLEEEVKKLENSSLQP